MTKKLQTLYKIDTKGKLREWTMHIDGASFYAVKGLVDGKKTTDKPTTTIAKNVGRANATTPQEQALLEAKAKFQKKLDSGYALNEIDAQKKKFYEPMLAHNYKDRQDELVGKYPVFSQPKLDGIRCIVRKEGDTLIGRTRKGKEIECIPHILKSLNGFFLAYPNAILDGELYNHDLRDNFNKITSLVRKQKPIKSDKMTDKAFDKKVAEYKERLSEAENTIQYHVYDAPRINDVINENQSFDFRIDELKAKLMTNKHIVLVETNEVYSLGNLNSLYGQYLEQGYEGQMVRKNSSKYDNKRSTSLLKRKEFIDAEYKVVDIDVGNGNRSGTAKHLVCYCPTTKTTFNSNIKGSFDYLKEIYDNRKDYIGKLATIKYFQLTPDGIPRFPYAIGFRDYE
jgi:ATP-dependent DNA ligase